MLPNACDCHAHVCGPESRYPYIPERLYTPHDALPADYRRMLDSLGVLRGVAVLPWDIHPQEIEKLHDAGVRGVRANIVDLKTGRGKLPLEELRKLAGRIKPFGWHVEFLMHVDEFPDLERQLGDFPVDV